MYNQGQPGRLPSKKLFDEGVYDLNNFKKIFLETRDIFEYRAATKLVGTWAEWQRLKRDWPQFEIFVAEWVEELKVLIQSEAMKKILKLSESNESSSLPASRFIVEGRYEGLERKPKRGRPSKAEIAGEAKKMARDSRKEQEELARVKAAAIKK